MGVRLQLILECMPDFLFQFQRTPCAGWAIDISCFPDHVKVIGVPLFVLDSLDLPAKPFLAVLDVPGIVRVMCAGFDVEQFNVVILL